jgi:hypothetical protein
MPRYFFHSVNRERSPDDEGVDLPDDRAAHAQAVAYAGEVLKFDPQRVWDSGQWRVEVTDKEGCLLFTVIILGIDAPKQNIAGSPTST